MSSKAKIFALCKAIDSKMLTKEQALIAISQGMEQRIRGYLRSHKPVTFGTITEEFFNDAPFLEQMARLEIDKEVLTKIANGYLLPETLAKLQDTAEQTYQSNKIGRNDSCPCGSGKKYKKCCGR